MEEDGRRDGEYDYSCKGGVKWRRAGMVEEGGKRETPSSVHEAQLGLGYGTLRAPAYVDSGKTSAPVRDRFTSVRTI